MFLRDLENGSDLEPSDNYQEEEEDEDDDPEQLAELERHREEIIEEFLELAYQKKHEMVEEVKQECKKNKAAKDVEKKAIQDMQSAMDAKRKQGIKDVKAKLAVIIENEQIGLAEKIARLQDTEQIKAFMSAYFAK